MNSHIEWIIEYVKLNPPAPPNQKQVDRLKERIDWIKPTPITGYMKLDILISELKNSITFMNSRDDSHLVPEFKKISNDLDRLRGEDTGIIFPELEPLLKGV